MKKTNLLWALLSILICADVHAQMFVNSVASSARMTEKQPEKLKAAVAEAPAVEPQRKVDAAKIKEIAEEEDLPVAMTVEQKSAIDLPAKKGITQSLQKKSVRDRKDFIDVMTSVERLQKRRAALLEGKDIKAAERVAEEVETPPLNLKSNKDMQKYMYQKAKLINE